MKYKKGQQVRIKNDGSYDHDLIPILEKYDYILTISKVSSIYGFYSDDIVYYMEETKKRSDWQTCIRWGTRHIEELYVEPVKPDPKDFISSRFEILDI